MDGSDKKSCGCNPNIGVKKISRPSFYGAKRPVQGEVIAEVNAKGGKLRLSKNWSRSLLAGQIHEIMVTGSSPSPGEELPEFTAIAFFEVSQGSHTVIGDKLFLNDLEVGTLVGYEMNHMPNHMNIVFRAEGETPRFKLGDEVTIQ